MQKHICIQTSDIRAESIAKALDFIKRHSFIAEIKKLSTALRRTQSLVIQSTG